MNSLNHYSYGSVVEWMYRHMCGLKPCESDPGFKRASLRPEPNRRMRWVKMRYCSAMGLYRSEWRIADDGRLEYLLEIPFNAQAEVFLPDARVEKLEGAEGLGFVQCGTGVAAERPAGVYHIAYLPEKPYLTGRFTLDTPMGELLADEARPGRGGGRAARGGCGGARGADEVVQPERPAEQPLRGNDVLRRGLGRRGEAAQRHPITIYSIYPRLRGVCCGAGV